DSFAQPAKAEPTEDPPRLVREDPPRTNPNELFKQWRERIGKRPGKGRPLAGRPPATRVSPYQQQVFQASGAVIGAAFRDRSRQVVSVSLNGEVELWDVKSGDKIAGKDGDASQSAAFTPDGKYAMAASANGSIRVISLPDMRIVHVLEGHQGTVRAMTVLPGGRLMSAGIDKTVRMWDLTTGAEVHKSESEDGMVFALAVSPDESTMAVAGYLSSSVLLLDLQQQPAAPLGVLEGAEGHDGIIRCLAFSPDGRLLLSGSRGSERTALVWDWKAKTVRRRLPGHPEGVTAAAFFPNGKTVVIGSGGMAGKGKPGGKYREAVIQVWDVESARSLAKLPGHWWAVTALSVSSDGKLILSGGFDGSVRVWKKPSAADESSKLDASLRGPREARDDRPRNATLSR
ncbi:MAG: WD40 repeat domain-containing protein, partial [Planctomycetales bacterium]